jgi:broad specificity phosphatase PhoE
MSTSCPNPIPVSSRVARKTPSMSPTVGKFCTPVNPTRFSSSRNGPTRIEFFREWLSVPDLVGWWLAHKNPPGDDAAAVAARIRTFAATLADRQDDTAFTVAVTHSPVLRAVAWDLTGADPGEPAWLAGLEAEIAADRSVQIRVLPDAP